MNLTLSVYFSNNRTFLALVEPRENGLELMYVNSTSNRIDLDNIENSSAGVMELENIISNFKDEISQLTVTLPSENVLVTKFPGKDNLSNEEMKKLVNLEIRQNYPQFNYDDFTSTTFNLAPKLDGTSMNLAVIIPKQNFLSCKKVLHQINLPILNIEISQFNAHNAFIFNYPEYKDKTVALLGVHDRFIDVSVIKDTKPLYYNLLNFKENDDFSKLIENEMNKIISEYANFLDAAYFFGSHLTKDILLTAKDGLNGIVLETGKINAFRMLSTNFDERERSYCAKTSHIFPPCIGACIHHYHERTKIV